MSMHPNVFNGHAEAWSCRWIVGADPRKYVVHVLLRGFRLPLRAAVVDDFGTLVEVPR